MADVTRASSVRRRRLLLLLATMAALAACGPVAGPSIVASTLTPTTAAPTVRATPATETPVPTRAAIVGEWVVQQDCAKIVALLEGAGLAEFVLESTVGNGLVPGITDPADVADPENPCDGAVLREHSHFFTAGGLFGSRDYDRQQVDDGRYHLVGNDILVINDRTFHYQIADDSMTLAPDPVDISACTTKMCRFEAAWVLMVALPGSTFTRR